MKRAVTGDALVTSLRRRFMVVNDDVRVGDRNVNVLRPRSAEDLIDEEAFSHDERLPYWAELWPSSTVLANFVAADPRPRGTLIELGAGIGLVSIAAALAGHQVTATDYYDDALAFVRANSYRVLGHEIDTMLVDWRDVPETLPRFETVLASDVLYESRYAPLVAEVIDRFLAARGVAYVADPGRVAADAFTDACRDRKLAVKIAVTRPYQAGKVRQTIKVYEITR